MKIYIDADACPVTRIAGRRRVPSRVCTYGDWEKGLYAESLLFGICAKRVK